ncbi:AVT1D [Scenedesmus sp. PABB004]|nr:AVT1D [Scenedesmus sp. PABB004]
MADRQDVEEPLLAGGAPEAAAGEPNGTPGTPLVGDHDWVDSALDEDEARVRSFVAHKRTDHKQSAWYQTTTALLSLQLGWGLWLFPHSFARLGWIPSLTITVLLAVGTAYSGSLYSRLFLAVPSTVLFGDVGAAAAGPRGRQVVYAIIYSLDATRCIILHLAATQSLQHALGDAAPPMWQCGLAVLVLAAAATQVRALSQLSWFFLTGTVAQLVAIGIVVYELLSDPDPAAKTELVRASGHYERQFVALFSMVFAFGGQFAFTELMTDMRRPSEFPKAISVCTVIMSTLYAALGSAGYWSKGLDVADIVIFSLGESALARVAAGCILIQALAQQLVNIHVWCHSLLVLLGRATGHKQSASARSAFEHDRWRWLAASLFVVTYSWLISVSLPYFSSLVGILASATYLACAYTLPCYFATVLLRSVMGRAELALCYALIPLSLCLSAAGMASSISALVQDIRAHGSGFGPPV